MTISETSENEVTLACNLCAIPQAELPRHGEVAGTLFGAVVETRELPDGFGFRLPPEPDLLHLAAEFIARERLCCPFYTFSLELAAAGGPLWLRLTGPDGTKEILRSGLDDLQSGQGDR